jgi:protoporphyrinogen oxidase
MEQKYGSLTRGVLQTRRQHRAAARLKPSSTNSPPLFATLKDGLGQLVNALNGRLEQSHLYRGRRVLAIERSIAGDGRLY